MGDDGLDDGAAGYWALTNACVMYASGWSGRVDPEGPSEDPGGGVHARRTSEMSWAPSRRLALWLRGPSQGLLNVGTLSARMAVLRSCALDI
jgi:hypothetical protein